MTRVWSRAALIMAPVGLLVVGCSDGDDTDAGSSSSPSTTSEAAVPASTLPWSDTVPEFAYPPPVDPLVMTITDEQGRHCVLVQRSTGDTQELCVDEPELLAISVTQPDTDGTIYLHGLTSSEKASYLLATGAGSTVRIELRSVDGWPERAFVAPLPFAPGLVQLFDHSGMVIADESL